MEVKKLKSENSLLDRLGKRLNDENSPENASIYACNGRAERSNQMTRIGIDIQEITSTKQKMLLYLNKVILGSFGEGANLKEVEESLL